MNRKSSFLFISLLLSTFFNTIKADDIHTDNDSVIMKYTGKEIVIESFKQNNHLLIQPVSATLISGSEIQERNISNIKELVSFVPNLFIPDYGSKMYSPVFIRGIGSRINAPSVALYVDGVPYFDRSTFDIDINDIDQIEVLRGPQGTIYGRNTMGGVINVYTKSPFNTNGTNLNLSAGNYENYKTGISHYNSVNNKVGYSISGNYSHGGGYFKNKYTDKKADPIDATSTRARLSWRIKPRLSMHLALAYEYSDQDGYPYRPYNITTSEISDIDYNSRSFYRRNMSSNGLHIDYITDNFKLGSQSSFQYFDGKQGLDQDFSSSNLVYVDTYYRQQMYSQEFNIKSIKKDQYEWQFGLFGFHQNFSQLNNINQYAANNLTIQNIHNPTDGLAIYHQSTLNDIFVKNLSFVFGLRYDWENTKLTFERTDKNIIDDTVNDKNSFSQITPKASVQYSFNKNGLTYFSITKGYKTGGFNTTADTEEDRTFDPEYSWCYELGTKSSLFNNGLHLEMSLFLIDWKNQQISQTKPSGQGYLLRNVGKSESKGIELSAQVNLLKNLSLQFAYGYTDARFKHYKDYKRNAAAGTVDTLVYDNNVLPMVPKNTVSLGANYIVNTNYKWLDNIVLNGQYMGIGDLYWNDVNEAKQPYYGTFNGKVSFVRKQLSVDLWAKNIGEKDYIAYYFTTGSGASTKHYVQKGKPFTCGINVNFKF